MYGVEREPGQDRVGKYGAVSHEEDLFHREATATNRGRTGSFRGQATQAPLQGFSGWESGREEERRGRWWLLRLSRERVQTRTLEEVRVEVVDLEAGVKLWNDWTGGHENWIKCGELNK